MKWIKSSERLPDRRHNYHVKVAQFSGNGVYNHAAVFDPKEKHFSDERFTDFGVPIKLNVIEWLDESQSESTPSISPEERDQFAMSFCAWYSHAEDAQVYKSQKLSAYKMLELYRSRPFLRTDSPQEN